ncbi:MAG: hypothetical protein Q7T56_13880 [Nocardioidaceae bacterium]|nr:hypothetical protein [Nocardioidaceae bacterium]
MALIAVASAKGSPGATTLGLVLGGLWPRPVIFAECDPAGSDVAIRLPAIDGTVLDPQRGLLSLVAAGRKELHPGLVREHTQTLIGGLDVLVGIGVPEQAAALSRQWTQFGPLFADLAGTDVIADLGRIGATTPQNNLLGSADAVVLVVDATPSNVVHVRERLHTVITNLGGPLGTPVHVVVVTEPKRTRAVREVRDALERAEVPVRGVHHVAHDHRGALAFQGQIKGDSSRTALVRSAAPLVRILSDDTEARFTSVPDAQEVRL